eukprot:GHVT01100545.1.p1 GENE.GHVT01100545.1~~GHVT01100545.1.p1  ORF type:complete len:190 (+),score=2.10 GHVT01100545.1:1064-1633(+)
MVSYFYVPSASKALELFNEVVMLEDRRDAGVIFRFKALQWIVLISVQLGQAIIIIWAATFIYERSPLRGLQYCIQLYVREALSDHLTCTLPNVLGLKWTPHSQVVRLLECLSGKFDSVVSEYVKLLRFMPDATRNEVSDAIHLILDSLSAFEGDLSILDKVYDMTLKALKTNNNQVQRYVYILQAEYTS